MTTYKRNQVEEAVWQLFNEGNTGAPMPPVFRTRLKRLLELDRRMQSTSKGDFAFQDEETEGRGIEVAFTSFNVFCLALGMDLMDMGFKQSEVVFILQNIRQSLSETHQAILQSPPTPPRRLSAKDRPNSPTMTIDGKTYADCSVFLLIQRVELTEAWPMASKDKPLVFEPEIAYGRTELGALISRMGLHHRKLLVLELADNVAMIEAYLPETSPSRRGPK